MNRRLMKSRIHRGPRGAGVIQLTGAAARPGMPGARVPQIRYGDYTGQEASHHAPRIVCVEDRSRLTRPQLRAEH